MKEWKPKSIKILFTRKLLVLFPFLSISKLLITSYSFCASLLSSKILIEYLQLPTYQKLWKEKWKWWNEESESEKSFFCLVSKSKFKAFWKLNERNVEIVFNRRNSHIFFSESRCFCCCMFFSKAIIFNDGYASGFHFKYIGLPFIIIIFCWCCFCV